MTAQLKGICAISDLDLFLAASGGWGNEFYCGCHLSSGAIVFSAESRTKCFAASSFIV